MIILQCRGLSRDYGPVKAVKSLDLQVHAGEIYGFLGLNGAGKTTTIRMLTGLIQPDSGSVELFGQDLRRHREAVLRRTGMLVESASAWPNLSVRENLCLQCQLCGWPTSEAERVTELLALGDYARRPARVLSLGNKQRLSLARALLGKPELLILDEPANGLDPAGIVEVRGLLRYLAREAGVGILMSSHLLDEVEQLADRVGIIHQGVMVKELAHQDLAAGMAGLEVDCSDNPALARMLTHRWPTLHLEHRDPGLFCQGPGLTAPELARLVTGAGLDLYRLESRRHDLESLFLSLTGGKP